MGDDIEFKLSITEAAKDAIRALLAKNDGTQIRFGIRGAGCSGYSWVFSPTKLPPTTKDIVLPFEGFTVLINPKSALFINGTTIDHEKSLLKEGFIFKSDKVVSKCGCGMSFDLKKEEKGIGDDKR